MSTAVNISEWLREPEYRLYNPSDEPIEIRYRAEDYLLPPNAEWPVKPRGAHQRLSENGRTWVPDRPVSAEEFIHWVVGKDGMPGKYSEAGIRLLTPGGDSSIDEKIKAEARDTWEQKRYRDCNALTRSFEAENAKLIDEKQDPRPATGKVLQAYEYMANRDRAAAMRYAFRCPKCAIGAATETEMRAHISHLHPAVVDVLLKAAGLAADAEESVPKKAKAKKVDISIEETA